MMHIMFARRTGKGNGGGRDPETACTAVSCSNSSINTGPSKRYDSSNAQCRGPRTAVTSQTPIANMAGLQQEDDINAVQVIEPIVLNPKVTHLVQAQGGGDTRVDGCLQLIADETVLYLDDLSGDAAFHELDVDSFISLALSDKMRVELGIAI